VVGFDVFGEVTAGDVVGRDVAGRDAVGDDVIGVVGTGASSEISVSGAIVAFVEGVVMLPAAVEVSPCGSYVEMIAKQALRVIIQRTAINFTAGADLF